MSFRFLTIIFAASLSAMLCGQDLGPLPVSEYGLPVVKGAKVYKKIVQADTDNMLVDLRDIIPEAKFDVKYATADNLIGRALYPRPDAFLRRPAAMALRRVQESLRSLGYGLVIHDGYRPYEITVLFYEEIKDTTYVADPRRGSRHNRGMAIDLSLYHLETGKVVTMPSGYDETTERSHHDYMGGDEQALVYRQILKDAMLDHGFEVYHYEWWHYDYEGWESCYTYDIWHNKIEKVNMKIYRKMR